MIAVGQCFVESATTAGPTKPARPVAVAMQILVDMLTTDATDGKEYLLVTNNSRGTTRVAFADVDQAAPMPVNVPHNFGPAGVPQYPIGLSAMSFSNAPVF